MRENEHDPALGRFIQPDSIIPDPGSANGFDRYAYVNNKPVNFNDPSGHVDQGEEQDAEDILNLLSSYGIKILKDWRLRDKKWHAGLWTLSYLQTVLDSARDLASAMGGAKQFASALGGVTISLGSIGYEGLTNPHRIWLNSQGFSNWTVVHEFAHAWDASSYGLISNDMQFTLNAGFHHPLQHLLHPNDPAYWYDPGNGPPPCGVDSNFNADEDFAEAVAAYVYPATADKNASARNWPYSDSARGYSYSGYLDTPRGQFIKALLVSMP